MKTFMNKQQWRFEQGVIFHRGPVTVIQLLLYIIIAIGVTDIVDLSLLSIGTMLAVEFLYFWSVVYAGYKSGYWLESESRRIKMNSSEALVHQYRLAGALTAEIIADTFNVDPSKAREALEEELLWFEARVKVK